MLIKLSSIHQDFYALKQDKIPGETINNLLESVKWFAPPKAKSYTIFNVFTCKNINNPGWEEVTFNVSYFTTKSEGKCLIQNLPIIQRYYYQEYK